MARMSALPQNKVSLYAYEHLSFLFSIFPYHRKILSYINILVLVYSINQFSSKIARSISLVVGKVA